MRIFVPPLGKAGSNQIDAIIESAHAELAQMFDQVARKRTLEHGVGRTVGTTDLADSKIQLKAQKRECEAQIAFHGGRALELALQVVYARAADRIIGREYPGVCAELMKRDRSSHSLKRLHDRMVEEFADRDMESALEDAYQCAVHSGIVDVFLDEKLLFWFFRPEDDEPFREKVDGGMMRGAEMTSDHADRESVFGLVASPNTAFSEMPYRTFPLFLEKVDAVYYESDVDGKRRNIRWTNYTARDHEYGRPYVVIGPGFFARLVGQIVALSNDQHLWHPDHRQRWHERRHYNIDDIVRIHLTQNWDGSVELPEIRSVEEAIDELLSIKRHPYPEEYDHLHKPWRRVSKRESD